MSLRELRRAATLPGESLARSLVEARQFGLSTVFLCHSHTDEALVLGLANLLYQTGWLVYVDWQDSSMPSTPDRQTAATIKNRIRTANYFMFLATPNSMESRWCPWEIGYADGVKSIDEIFVVPTTDESGRFYGNEYLQLYRRVDVDSFGELGAWMPGRTTGAAPFSTF